MLIFKIVARRLALAVITLWLLSVIVFVGTQLIPADPAIQILGPTADPQAITALNHQLGLDRPALARYGSLVAGFFSGDLGTSYSLRQPISGPLVTAAGASLKLAAVAFVLVVPLSLIGGVIAATREGRAADRIISTTGLSFMIIPEFVSGIVLILVFGIELRWLPITATPPDGAGFLEQARYLILPAIPLVLVLFGYIARVTRAATIDALAADYTRTATLKGVPRARVLVKHVLRNSAGPAITVIATQVGYLFGGLVVIEILFNYHGIGLMIFEATQKNDFPVLEACVLTMGALYLGVTLIADIGSRLLNPAREAA